MNNQISSNSKEDPDNKSESSGSSEEDDKEIPIDLNEVESDSDQDDEKSDEDKKDKQLSDSDELIGSESDENIFFMNNQISSNSKEDPDNKSESSGSSEEDDKEIPIDLNEVESDSDQDDEKSDEDKKDKQLSDSDELIGSESDENVSQIPFGNQDSEDSDSSGLELKKVDLTDQNNNKRQQFDLISDWQQKEKQRQEMLALKVMQQVKEKRREAELQEQIKLGKVNERNLLVPLDKNQGIQLLMSGIDETNKNAENNQLSYLIMTERQETKKREFYRGNQMRV
ncbi:MAG: hypothetical protein EZS28_006040 [Streblomastix strix]|uniref:Uncharacterized protein n=1 Tax=Streblomastix strix TaxID=222440 RepID=A0A5J4WVP2_9EUKA|nr:MAG: hypothetical protein EZS28_006040 [Streblomastix strix]